MNNSQSYGTLFLVGTPIGNLDDMTQRAIKTLGHVQWLAAEDTRQTQKLLNHFALRVPMISYHEHNYRRVGPELIAKLQAGDNVALVSDAGMPAISDPGEDLVRLAVQADVPVTVIPGPSAGISALVLSGLATSRFVFEGFLPVKGRERQKRLAALGHESRTMILYEAPHRLLKTLQELRDQLGAERPAAAVREITKLYEEARRGTLADLLDHFSKVEPRGEFVLIVAGSEGEEEALDPGDALAKVAELVEQGMPKKEAIKEAAKLAKMDKRELYQMVVEQDRLPS